MLRQRRSGFLRLLVEVEYRCLKQVFRLTLLYVEKVHIVKATLSSGNETGSRSFHLLSSIWFIFRVQCAVLVHGPQELALWITDPLIHSASLQVPATSAADCNPH